MFQDIEKIEKYLRTSSIGPKNCWSKSSQKMLVNISECSKFLNHFRMFQNFESFQVCLKNISEYSIKNVQQKVPTKYLPNTLQCFKKFPPNIYQKFLIGTRINKSESQTKHGQSIFRTITTHPVHEVNEYNIYSITQVYYITHSNTRVLCQYKKSLK